MPSTPGAQRVPSARRRRGGRCRRRSQRRVHEPCSRRRSSPTFLWRHRRCLECLLPARRLRMMPAHMRRRPVSRACCRRSLVALVLHPVVLWSNHRRCDSLAEPMVAACLRHVPARRRHVRSARACLAQSLQLHGWMGADSLLCVLEEELGNARRVHKMPQPPGYCQQDTHNVQNLIGRFRV